METIGILGLVVGGISYLVGRGIVVSKRDRAAHQLAHDLRKGDTPVECVVSRNHPCEIWEINHARQRWPHFVAAVSAEEIRLYTVPEPQRQFPSPYILPVTSIRWFGRPKKYSMGVNEMWLHAETDGGWTRLRLRLWRDDMQALVRLLKDALPDDLVRTYRRQRPYVHFGPEPARPAEQDMLGAWTLGDHIDLYLMPSHLVVLLSSSVQHVFPLESIQKIAAFKRLDQARADGLVRFEVDGASYAFALPAHEAFAALLAEAAKRSLIDPVDWQRKKKKDEPEDE